MLKIMCGWCKEWYNTDLPYCPCQETKLPGACGPVWAPKDKKTGRAIPTSGKCSCGSSESVLRDVREDNREVTQRVCAECGNLISATTHKRKKHGKGQA